MLSSISIKLKMALIVIIPVFVILISLGMDSYRSYNEVAILSQIQEMVSFTQKSSSLVHNLQKERGASAGFISSKGEAFSSELNSIRRDTDEKYDELKKFYSSMNKETHSSALQDKRECLFSWRCRWNSCCILYKSKQQLHLLNRRDCKNIT
jgi:methyl-accepting chemotaxis protein